MSVCLSVPSVPSRPVPEKKSLKQKILLNKVVRYTSRVTKKYSQSCCGAGRGKAELCIFDFKATLKSFITSSESVPSSCVCSTPRKYPQSKYFIVIHIFLLLSLYIFFHLSLNEIHHLILKCLKNGIYISTLRFIYSNPSPIKVSLEDGCQQRNYATV